MEPSCAVWFVPPAEACSTTEDEDEPLHCPTGYECHIINPGNPGAGIPNRGQCIKQRGNSGTTKLMLKTRKLLVCASLIEVADISRGQSHYYNFIMPKIKQFFYFHFGSTALTDGRSLRHKYFKDYKDYLGK